MSCLYSYTCLKHSYRWDVVEGWICTSMDHYHEPCTTNSVHHTNVQYNALKSLSCRRYFISEIIKHKHAITSLLKITPWSRQRCNISTGVKKNKAAPVGNLVSPEHDQTEWLHLRCRNQLRGWERPAGQRDGLPTVGRPGAPSDQRVPSALQGGLHSNCVVQVHSMLRVWRLT